jgi:hypothetical protein
MLNTDDSILPVLGGQSMTLYHRHGRLPTPQQLDLGDDCTAGPAICRIDDFSDAMVLADSQRVTCPAGTVTVQSVGRLPFGTAFRFSHSARYTPGLARITTDLTVPSRAEIGHVQMASLVLGDGWTHCAELTAGGLSAMRRLTDEPVVWDTQLPLAIVLSDGGDRRLEIGCGADLWRWYAGVGGSANKSRFELGRDDQGLSLNRTVTSREETAAVDPRVYRFTWYMSWQVTGITSASERAAIVPEWTTKGDVCSATLSRQLAEQPDGEILIDIGAMRWDKGQLKAEGTSPCAAARSTTKRLKRVIRQLQTPLSESDISICFTGFQPSDCSVGSHVFRSGQRLHWDLPAILDFAQWTRQQLGPSRQLRVSGCPDLPSLHAMFNAVEEDDGYEPYDEP